MLDLLSWLRSTIKADLAAAKAADEVSPGPWVNTGQGGEGDAWQIHGEPTGETEWDFEAEAEVPVLSRVATLNYSDGGGVWEREAADHMVLQQPSHTIARCESELAILDEYEGWSHGITKALEADGMAVADPPKEWQLRELWVHRIAHGYRNRPGWKDGWDPTPAQIREWLAGAEERRKLPAKPDDMEALKGRLDALKAERGPVE